MALSALFLGSIGVLAETSDIQRRAYNQALREAGLNWTWDRDTYASLLEINGGKDRLRLISDAADIGLSDKDIGRIHARKTELACERIRKDGVALRPGVRELVDLALDSGLTLAWVTTTYQPNIDAIIDAMGTTLPIDRFAAVVTRECVGKGKPAPDAYRFAMDKTGVARSAALAVEDTMLSVLSAKRAGITTVMIPGELTSGQDGHEADHHYSSLVTASGELQPGIVALVTGKPIQDLSDAA